MVSKHVVVETPSCRSVEELASIWIFTELGIWALLEEKVSSKPINRE